MTTTTNNNAQLEKQVILITGAARGIGAAVAKDCARQGATVILLDKNLALLEQTYDQIEAETHITPALYPLDLKGASAQDYEELASTIESTFAGLDALIHCAASLGQLAPVQLQSKQLWAETIHINLTASFLLTQACLPLLRKQSSSHLIFTSDEYKDKAYWGAYGISKAAIEALALQLKDELETEAIVKVDIINPGKVKTELFVQAFPAINPESLPKPEDISAQYLALLK